MSAVVTLLSAGEAQRLTQRIKLTASTVRDNLFKLRNLVDEAKNSNAWNVLGYPSWTAYLADTLADEPMRLGREERQELVGYLSGEGLSTRAIAPIVGVTHETVAQDIKTTAPVRNLTPAPEPGGSAQLPEEEVTGQVEPPAPRPVTGLDGKTYVRPEPRPVPTGEDVARLNAETESKALGRALMTLTGMKHDAHRNRIITQWWPLGNDSVPPDSRALFEPGAIREIASWLMQLADDLEVAP